MLKNDDFLNYDSDGDGKMDSHIDFNNDYTDNVSDLWLIDSDGDGVADDFLTVDDDNVYEESYDLDGDGKDDVSFFGVDANEDGVIDSVITEVDLDGDGQADIVTYEADVNFDGKADYTEIQLIAEDNSTDDLIIRYADTDLDGKTDSFSINTDEDYFLDRDDMDLDFDDTDAENSGEEESDDTDYENSGEEESDDTDYENSGEEESYEEEEYNYEGSDEEGYENGESDETEGEGEYIELDTVDYDTNADNSTMYYDLENFDPADADADGVVGDPEEALDLWEYQGNTNRCAIYSQKFVIEEFTGEEVDIEELCDVAEENGWFSEDGGTPIMYMDKLLDHYGVPNETSFDNDIQDISDSLADGKRVIVAVDADEIWAGENDTDMYEPGDGVDHAIEVIGIDNSDPENPMVIVNDSGNPDGQGVMIPMDTFVDAWEDSDCYMVECM